MMIDDYELLMMMTYEYDVDWLWLMNLVVDVKNIADDWRKLMIMTVWW